MRLRYSQSVLAIAVMALYLAPHAFAQATITFAQLNGTVKDTSDRTIAGAAVTDLTEQYNLSDGNAARRHSYGGSPWTAENDKYYREQSPLTYARDIRTPTLILATTGDARVPITQSYKLFHALKDNGVPVTFVAYPVGGHFPADPVRQKDVYRRWVAWLDERLK